VGAVTPYKLTKYHKDKLADYPAKKRCNLGNPCVVSAQPPWLEKKSFKNVYVCNMLCAMLWGRIMWLNCWFCGPDKGTFLRLYVHNICKQYTYTVYTRALSTYLCKRVYVCTHSVSRCTCCVQNLATGLVSTLHFLVLAKRTKVLTAFLCVFLSLLSWRRSYNLPLQRFC
jgi:hypothetical protein